MNVSRLFLQTRSLTVCWNRSANCKKKVNELTKTVEDLKMELSQVRLFIEEKSSSSTPVIMKNIDNLSIPVSVFHEALALGLDAKSFADLLGRVFGPNKFIGLTWKKIPSSEQSNIKKILAAYVTMAFSLDEIAKNGTMNEITNRILHQWKSSLTMSNYRNKKDGTIHVKREPILNTEAIEDQCLNIETIKQGCLEDNNYPSVTKKQRRSDNSENSNETKKKRRSNNDKNSSETKNKLSSSEVF